MTEPPQVLGALGMGVWPSSLPKTRNLGVVVRLTISE